MPEVGIEPTRLLRTQDFESSASTIPPLGHQWVVDYAMLLDIKLAEEIIFYIFGSGCFTGCFVAGLIFCRARIGFEML